MERGFLLPNHGSLHAETPSHDVIFCILSLLAPIAFLLMVFLTYSALYSAKYNGPIEPNKNKKTKNNKRKRSTPKDHWWSRKNLIFLCQRKILKNYNNIEQKWKVQNKLWKQDFFSWNRRLETSISCKTSFKIRVFI